MPLYTILREYEDRRQALIDQLKSNPDMDPAVQHQIYGAIKEIENFLKTVEFQIATSREQSISIELARDRPRPFVERTKKLAGKVTGSVRKVGGSVASGAKRVVTVPRRYAAKRKERKELKRQIERELLARLQHNAASTGTLPQHIQSDLGQPLPPMPEPVEDALEPDLSSIAGDIDLPSESPQAEPARKPKKRTVKRAPAKKSLKKPVKKAAKKKAVKRKR